MQGQALFGVAVEGALAVSPLALGKHGQGEQGRAPVVSGDH